MSYDRYKNALEVTENDGTWFAADAIFDTTVRADDLFWTVRERDRLDTIAYRVYGDPLLWWVIAEYNKKFWILDLSVNEVLRLPSYEHLNLDLLI